MKPGNAIAFGTGFKVPVSLKIDRPNPEPLSNNVNLEDVWYRQPKYGDVSAIQAQDLGTPVIEEASTGFEGMNNQMPVQENNLVNVQVEEQNSNQFISVNNNEDAGNVG